MPLSLDSVTNRKLVLAKQLLGFASQEASNLSRTVSLVTAVILFDLSIETVLRAFAAAAKTSEQPERTFQGLLDQVTQQMLDSGLGELPNEAHIRHVHAVRNNSQHKAIHPTRDDVTACETYCREFLEVFLPQAWGIPLAHISLTQLVRNDRVREYLQKAEQALGTSEFALAIQIAFTGLDYALDRIRSYSAVVGPTLTTGDILDPGALGAIRQLQDSVAVVALGLNYFDYLENRSLLRKSSVSGPEAAAAINFAIDAAIRVEQTVGDILKWWH